MAIGSHDHGGQEVPQSAVCKLENQGSWWYNSVRVQRPETRETNGVSSSWGPKAQKLGGNGLSPSPSLKDQEPGVPMSQGRRWMSHLKQRTNLPFCCLFVLFRLSIDWMMSTHFSEKDLFYSVYQFKC